jgi:FtsP/CotA-like multicopper oxidase with cupredoxin domain
MLDSRNFLAFRELSVGLMLSAGLMLGLLDAAPTAAQHGANPQPMPASSLDPMVIDKYVDPLVIPPAIPRTSKIKVKGGNKNIDYYEIAVRQFQQQILPTGMPSTTVWSYGAVGAPATFNYPAFTIEAKWKKPVRVKWINELVKDPNDCFYTPGGPVHADSCDYLPHLLPVDQTLHWANPAFATLCKTGQPGTDCRTNDPTNYTGPVPMIVHVHGAETTEYSDGYPEAWYLPAADNLAGYATGGSFYDTFKSSSPIGADWGPGAAVFEYPNDQEATTLWYHDHTLGMTRLNVYAGPAGFYILRGGPGDAVIGTLPGPAPALGDPPGLDYYEIPIAIQDRSFGEDGSLFYPDNRAFFEGLTPDQLQIPFIPDETLNRTGCEPGTGECLLSDVSPVWNPEFFGNTIVTNGKTWPYLDTEPRRYRYRFLNGSQSRFLILRLVTATDPDDPSTWVQVPGAFWQIGAEQGFLPAPVQLDELLMGPAERADTIMDFSAITIPADSGLYLVNVAPDEPFGGGLVGVDFDPADPMTTGQVMEFRPVPLKGVDASTPPGSLILPAPPVLPAVAQATRTITLNEDESMTVCVVEDMDGNVVEVDCTDPAAAAFGPTEALLGTLNADGTSTARAWAAPTTENVSAGNTEVWEIYNFTADAHPIHIHLVQFQVLDRQALATDEEGMAIQPAELVGMARGPEVWETGFKDTVIAYPGEVTRVKATFPIDGLFVWHCHILEHEDNEMMRPYCVGNTPACQQHNDHQQHHGN